MQERILAQCGGRIDGTGVDLAVFLGDPAVNSMLEQLNNEPKQLLIPFAELGLARSIEKDALRTLLDAMRSSGSKAKKRSRASSSHRRARLRTPVYSLPMFSFLGEIVLLKSAHDSLAQRLQVSEEKIAIVKRRGVVHYSVSLVLRSLSDASNTLSGIAGGLRLLSVFDRPHAEAVDEPPQGFRDLLHRLRDIQRDVSQKLAEIEELVDYLGL